MPLPWLNKCTSSLPTSPATTTTFATTGHLNHAHHPHMSELLSVHRGEGYYNVYQRIDCSDLRSYLVRILPYITRLEQCSLYTYNILWLICLTWYLMHWSCYCRLPIYQSAMTLLAQVELCFDPIQFLSGMFGCHTECHLTNFHSNTPTQLNF